jgi:hypothetical protein
VKANREAATLNFAGQSKKGIQKVTTASLQATFRPETEMEQEVRAALAPRSRSVSHT